MGQSNLPIDTTRFIVIVAEAAAYGRHQAVSASNNPARFILEQVQDNHDKEPGISCRKPGGFIV
ncbi:MAG TPA: hypothetical protein VK971_12205 [Thiohalobacter sp.]|nr:hypothetical protein [Thiohalobacter sp.]